MTANTPPRRGRFASAVGDWFRDNPAEVGPPLHPNCRSQIFGMDVVSTPGLREGEIAFVASGPRTEAAYVHVDYSQLEMRVIAQEAMQPELTATQIMEEASSRMAARMAADIDRTILSDVAHQVAPRFGLPVTDVLRGLTQVAESANAARLSAADLRAALNGNAAALRVVGDDLLAPIRTEYNPPRDDRADTFAYLYGGAPLRMYRHERRSVSMSETVERVEKVAPPPPRPPVPTRGMRRRVK